VSCEVRIKREIRIGFAEPGYWSYIGNDRLTDQPSQLCFVRRLDQDLCGELARCKRAFWKHSPMNAPPGVPGCLSRILTRANKEWSARTNRQRSDAGPHRSVAAAGAERVDPTCRPAVVFRCPSSGRVAVRDRISRKRRGKPCRFRPAEPREMAGGERGHPAKIEFESFVNKCFVKLSSDPRNSNDEYGHSPQSIADKLCQSKLSP
jgi:hypothetical protein